MACGALSRHTGEHRHVAIDIVIDDDLTLGVMDYKERSRINTAVAQFNVVGSLVFWVTPILLFELSGTTSITGTSLTAIAWLYLVLMPAGLVLAAVVVPKGVRVATQTLRLRDIFASVRLNRPLQHYLLAYGMWSWLAVRIGRQKVWALSLLLSALSRPFGPARRARNWSALADSNPDLSEWSADGALELCAARHAQ